MCLGPLVLEHKKGRERVEGESMGVGDKMRKEKRENEQTDERMHEHRNTTRIQHITPIE